jgi:phosphoserine aminotransferase
MMKKHNFSAGPAILPQEVLKHAAVSVLDFSGTGLSVLEVSHRSKEVVEVIEEAEALTRKLLNVPRNYAVLFLSGGASSQFYMTAMNLLGSGQKAGYINTGSWSTKAIKEARNFGEVIEVASSKDKNFNYIPKKYKIPVGLKYLHITSNNTIFGTQWKRFPNVDIPLVCDMSSDIFSRPVDVKKFAIIYAGAQKNLGPAGTTLVIVKKSLLGKVKRVIPTMLDYRTHIDKNSAFNTPPVYAIYVSMLTMRWLMEQGGVEPMEKRNKKKAKVLYDEIDRNPLFDGTVEKADRSLMNVPFVMKNEKLNGKFLQAAAKAGCVGLKGHRSVGGFRASIYNAMSLHSVNVLVDLMKQFESKYA